MDRFKGMIYGTIIGDCLGSFNEFKSPKSDKLLDTSTLDVNSDIENVFGMTYGYFTDDTSMMLALLDSINSLDGIYSYRVALTRYLQWYRNAVFSSTDKVFDIGIATSENLSKFTNGNIEDVINTRRKGDQEGNGVLMRLAPLIHHSWVNNWSYETLKVNLMNEVALTHDSKRQPIMLARFVMLMHDLLDGCKLEVFIDELDLLVERYKTYDEEYINSFIPNGWVIDSLEICSLSLSVNYHQRHDVTNYSHECLHYVTSFGGDADTNGAIMGMILGAMYGNVFDEKYTKNVRRIKMIDKMIETYKVNSNGK